jgi:hypothetical protein
MHVFLIPYPYNPDSILLQVMKFILDLLNIWRAMASLSLSLRYFFNDVSDKLKILALVPVYWEIIRYILDKK